MPITQVVRSAIDASVPCLPFCTEHGTFASHAGKALQAFREFR